MFSDKSINIHYRAPTSRLLKMNTLNEFELNKLKKFYAEELAQRLQRTSSSRAVPSRAAPAASRRPASPEPQADLGDVVDLKRYQHALSAKRHRLGAAWSPAGRPGGRAKAAAAANFARALYDFQASGEGEMSLRRGDLVELLGLVDSQAGAGQPGWANVEDCQSGLQGLVPLSYLDHSIGCAVAKRDVQSPASRSNSRASQQQQQQKVVPPPQQQFQTPPTPLEQLPLLEMSKGEPIVLLRRLSGHLYEASNTRHALGLVWSNDVEIIKQPEVGQPEQQQPQQTCGPPTDSSFTDGELEAEREEEVEEIEDDAEQWLRQATAHLDPQQPMVVGRRARSESNAKTAPRGGGGGGQQSCCSRPPMELTGGACECHLDYAKAHPMGWPIVQQPDSPRCPEGRRGPRRSSSSPMIGAELPQAPVQQQVFVDHEQHDHFLLDEQQQQHTTATVGRHQQRMRRSERLQLKQRQQSHSLPRLCRARFAYKPRQRDELELVVDDILVVVHECDDGWLIGSSYTTKQSGTFPGNFVEPI